MKRFCFFAFLFAAAASSVFGQAVDTTVCAVLNDPASFNGKTVRIKGTVVAGFDQFVITDGDCGKEVNGIWLSYPQGVKAKSGPLAMIALQPAHNFAGKVAAAPAAVTLTRDKEFKQFDSLLSQRHEPDNALCLGCARNKVQATLVGRLDGVDDAELDRDANGKIIGLGGFGNLNAYPARLMLESVSDVVAKPIDYSTSDQILKKAPSSGGQSNNQTAAQSESNPEEAAQKLIAVMGSSPIVPQIKSDLALLPQGKNPGEIKISYGRVSELSGEDGAPSAEDSPDGVIYHCMLDRDHLPGLELTMALMHLAQHASDAGRPRAANVRAPLYLLENNAWAVTATMGIAGGEKYMILPGGYMFWDASWPNSDKVPNMESALNDFLDKEAMLRK